MLDAALTGLTEILRPWPMFLMVAGIIGSSIFAALPGIGVLMLITIALPFAITLDPYAAMALLLGIGAVSNTANTFPSVLIAVPGSGGAQATIVDGYPMARRGEAKRAFGAAFTASPLGGIFGAIVLLATIPILRPLVLSFGSPEILMLVIWGLSAVGTLSGNAPLKGLVVAALGVLISTVGIDNKTGLERFDMGGMYLWDGISIVMVGLGVFAVPEMIALAVRRTAISERADLGHGLLQGVKDTFRNWWLVMRCSAIGVWVGVLPGLGGSVADWFAYGHAVQTEKNNENFGKGDVRGVIAPEASNNAKEGGALIPTIAFGIPGSTSYALMLTGFIAVGIAPGRAMLEEQLPFTMSMIWILVISNLIAAALAIFASNAFARIALLPFYVIVPVTLVLCVSSSFSTNYVWWDVLVFLGFSVLGYLFKVLEWPRPPLLVAVVLGSKLETNLWISQARYGWNWLLDPFVLAIIALIVFTLLIPLIKRIRKGTASLGGEPTTAPTRARYIADNIFLVFIAGVFIAASMIALQWESLRASLVIYSVTGLAVALLGAQLVLNLRAMRKLGPGLPSEAEAEDRRAAGARTLEVFGWILGLVAAVGTIGFHVTLPAFVLLYVKAYRGSWLAGLVMAAASEAFLIVIFDLLLRVAWPTPYFVRLLF